MAIQDLPKGENIYDTLCPILYAMDIIGQKWKLPILWYIAERGRTLIPALESIYHWAEGQMKTE